MSSIAPRLAARLLASLAVVVFAATFVATQIDFVRRHRPGIAPEVYLRPQALQVLAPGLSLGVALAFSAWLVARRQAAH